MKFDKFQPEKGTEIWILGGRGIQPWRSCSSSWSWSQQVYQPEVRGKFQMIFYVYMEFTFNQFKSVNRAVLSGIWLGVGGGAELNWAPFLSGTLLKKNSGKQTFSPKIFSKHKFSVMGT